MKRIAAVTSLVLLSMLLSPAMAQEKVAVVTLPGETVPVDAQGWVEDETVTELTPQGTRSDVFSDSLTVALQEERIAKVANAKKDSKQTSVITTAKK